MGEGNNNNNNNNNKEQTTLKDILLQKPAMQRQNTLKNISRSILPILEKGIVSPLIVHKVLKEYLLVGGASLRTEAANSIAAPAFLRMFHTREGATAIERDAFICRRETTKASFESLENA